MAIPNRFNLLDEPWIPIVGKEFVSLRQIFSDKYGQLGGNPIQKIALTKLLLAIAQSACTPEDEKGWQDLTALGMAEKSLSYLDSWRDAFWLYGAKPFLQMPAIQQAAVQSFGAVLPEIAVGNTSLITQWQRERHLTDADKALLITTLMGLALGGKKTDNSVSITAKYEKKPTGKPGADLGFLGYLHNFLMGQTVWETLWLNLITHEQLKRYPVWTRGLGTAPWEKMPTGEDCRTAKELKESYLGRLVPLSRFCLLADDGLHYSEGIAFSSHKEGGVLPSIAVDRSKKEIKAAWVDPEKRPWRWITSFLSCLGKTKSQPYDCLLIQEGLKRITSPPVAVFGLWSGGLRVSSNAGEQYLSGKDDFVESQTWLQPERMGELWFMGISAEMEFLDELAKKLYAATCQYHKHLKSDGSKQAQVAVHTFWQLCEHSSQELFDSDEPKKLRRRFIDLACAIYDRSCPRETARQLESWIRNRGKIKAVCKISA